MDEPVNINAAPWTFDRADYDACGDVLYLHSGDPAQAAAFESSMEGHGVRYDQQGRVVGLTLVNVRWLLERDGVVTLTLTPQRIEASDLIQVIAARRRNTGAPPTRVSWRAHARPKMPGWCS